MSERTVRADDVGSLLRPARLIDALEQETGFRHDQVRPSNASLEFANADQDAIREVTDECIREVVAKQEAIGLDSVTDGEFRRVFFMGSLDQAVSGFAPRDMAIEFHKETAKIDVDGRPVGVDRLAETRSSADAEARCASTIAYMTLQ